MASNSSENKTPSKIDETPVAAEIIPFPSDYLAVAMPESKFGDVLGLGYEELPIIQGGKACLMRRWTKEPITESQLAEWRQHVFQGNRDRRYDRYIGRRSTNTGVRTGSGEHPLAVVDSDALDPALAKKVNDIVLQVLGPSPLHRIGSKPGGAHFYVNHNPRRKMYVKGTDAAGVEHKFEILGDGNQLVCFGAVDADEEKGTPAFEYRWRNGECPLTYPAFELPVTTGDKLADLIRAVEALYIAEGLTGVEVSGVRDENEEKPITESNGDPVTLDELLKIVSFVDPGSVVRQGDSSWSSMAAAFKFAPVIDNAEDVDEETKRDLFVRWSRGEWHGGQPSNWKSDEDAERLFDDMDPPSGSADASFGSLVKLAQKNGYTGRPVAGLMDRFSGYDTDSVIGADDTGTATPGSADMDGEDDEPSFPAARKLNGSRNSHGAWNIFMKLPAGAPGIKFGDELSGKTFVAVYEACCILLEQIEHYGVGNHHVRRHGAVVYFAAEGADDVEKRFREQVRHMAPAAKFEDLPLYIYDSSPILTSKSAVDDAVRRVKMDVGNLPVIATYFDTAQYAMDGDSSEDKNGDVSQLYRGLRYLTRSLRTKKTAKGGTAISVEPSGTLIRHVGHGDKTRVRGAKDWESSSEFRDRIESYAETELPSGVKFPTVIASHNLKLKGYGRQGTDYFKTERIVWTTDDVNEDTGEITQVEDSTLVLTPVSRVDADAIKNATPRPSSGSATASGEVINSDDRRLMDRLDDAITVLEPRRRYTPTEIAKLAFPSDAQAVDVEAFRGWLKRTFVIAPMDDKGRRKRKSDRVKAIQSYFGGCFESGSRGLVFKMPDDMTDRAHRDEDFGQP